MGGLEAPKGNCSEYLLVYDFRLDSALLIAFRCMPLEKIQ